MPNFTPQGRKIEGVYEERISRCATRTTADLGEAVSVKMRCGREGELDRDHLRPAQQCNRVKSICSSAPSLLLLFALFPTYQGPLLPPPSILSQCPNRSAAIYSRAEQYTALPPPTPPLSIRAMLAGDGDGFVSATLGNNITSSRRSQRKMGTERKGGARS